MPREISIDELSLGAPLPCTLFSPVGERLLERGLALTERRRAAFRDVNIDTVHVPNVGEPAGECGAMLRGMEKSVEEIEDGDVLEGAVIDDKGQFLMQDGEQLNLAHRDVLARRGVMRVSVRRRMSQEAKNRYDRLKAALFRLLPNSQATGLGKVIQGIAIPQDRLQQGLRKRMTGKIVTDFSAAEMNRSIARDPRVRALVEPPRVDELPSEEESDRLRVARARLHSDLVDLFAALDEGESVDGERIVSIAREMISRMVGERFHRLHLFGEGEEGEYLSTHALSTALIAVNIAGRLEYAMEELLELATAALLHDIGMARIAPTLRDKREELTVVERRTIMTHPTLGIDMLENVSRLPVSAPIVAFQENERCDGSGYPRGLSAAALHPFSRIVAIAASYDAMTRERPYRAAMHPYHAIEALLQGVKTGKYDGAMAKVFLESFGLFPINCGVQLSDGRMGTVLDAGGPEYTRPVVVTETDERGKKTRDTEVIDLQKEKYKTTRIIKPVDKPFREEEGE